MAKLFVFSDDFGVGIEIDDPEGASEHRAVCAGCGADLVAETHARWTIADTIATAETHADRCKPRGE